MLRKRKVALMATALVCAAPTVLVAEAADAGGLHSRHQSFRSDVGGHAQLRHSDRSTATPIKHVVVIFQENVSFDHYFGTYPNAANLAGETPFVARGDTPKVNNLVTPLDVNHNFGPLAAVD